MTAVLSDCSRYCPICSRPLERPPRTPAEHYQWEVLKEQTGGPVYPVFGACPGCHHLLIRVHTGDKAQGSIGYIVCNRNALRQPPALWVATWQDLRDAIVRDGAAELLRRISAPPSSATAPPSSFSAPTSDGPPAAQLPAAGL